MKLQLWTNRRLKAARRRALISLLTLCVISFASGLIAASVYILYGKKA